MRRPVTSERVATRGLDTKAGSTPKRLRRKGSMAPTRLAKKTMRTKDTPTTGRRRGWPSQ